MSSLKMHLIGEGDFTEPVNHSIGNIQIVQFCADSYQHECLECEACLCATCVWPEAISHESNCTGRAVITDAIRKWHWDRTIRIHLDCVELNRKAKKFHNGQL